jgi:hypothetical protein
VTTLPTALAILEGTPRVLRAMVYGVPEAVLLRAPSEEPGAWCARDVIAHLVVNDPIALERFRRMTVEDHPAITNFDEEAALAASGARERPIVALLDEVARGRLELVTYLDTLTPEQLQRTGEHSTVGPMRSIELVHHLAYHDLNHIRQVATILGEPLDEQRGPMRVF